MGRWRLILSAVLVACLGVPLAFPFIQAVAGVSTWPLGSEGARLLELGRNTLMLIAGALSLCVPVGVVGAVLLYRTDLSLRYTFRFLTVLTLFVPLPLYVSGWQATFGSGGLLPLPSWSIQSAPDPNAPAFGSTWMPWAQGIGAAIWVHAIAGLPWVVWLTGRGLRWVEPELEEDALTSMPAACVLLRVTLRRSAAAIGTAALWVALQTATEVTVTDMMQVRTYGEEVFNQFVRADRDLVPRLVAVALPSVLLSWLLIMTAVTRWQRSLPALVTVSPSPRLFRLGRLRWPILAGVLVVVALLALVPLASLVWKAGLAGSPERWSAQECWDALAKAARTRSGLIARSLLLAGAAGILASALALLTCWLAVEARRFRFALLTLVAVAWALPAPITGIGLKETIAGLLQAVPIRSLAIALYYGPSPLPGLWVNLIRFFPCAVAFLWPVVCFLPRELRDAARVDGARPWQELWYVLLPLTGTATARAALAVAVLSLGELGAGKLVETPGSETFAHELFSQMHYGTGRDIAALCLLLLFPVLLGGALVALGRLWSGRQPPAA